MSTAKHTLVRYAVVDAFTDAPFKGNPGAVCLLTEEDWFCRGDSWMQSVAAEFNISETAFLVPDAAGTSNLPRRFRLRWFTPVAEVDLCGHGTLAAAHFVFRSGLVEGETIEFDTKSGILTAKRVGSLPGNSDFGDERNFAIELDFPAWSVVECEPSELPSLPVTLRGTTVVNVMKTPFNDLLVELSSGEDVANIQPQFDEIRKCAGRGVLITGPAPDKSGFDFYSRFFCPKFGINEDPVCGSAHCALAPYWRGKLGKCNLIAFMASSRSGRLDLFLDEKIQRVRIRGEAVTVMVGSLLA